MAEPQDSATIVFEDLTAGLMTQYEGGLHSQFERLGSTTNRWFKPNKKRLTGKDFEVKVEHRRLANARVSDDVFAAFPTPRAYGLTTYTISIDETSADNDLHRVATSIRVSHVDIKRAMNNPHEVVNLVERLRTEAVEDANNSVALHRWLDTNSTLATVDGDPVQNDNFFYGSGSAHTNQTSCRAKLTSGSIGRFTDGMVIDVRNSGGADYAANGEDVTVIDVNVVDKSIGISGSADLAAITTGDTLHLSDEYGNSITSMGAWFGGETTIFGVNRATGGNRWMIPTRTRVGATAAPWNPEFLNEAALAAGYIRDERSRFVGFTTPDIMNDVIEKADEKTVFQAPLTANSNPFATYGFKGFIYFHPSFGELALQTDPYCADGIVRIMDMSTWGSLWGTTENFQWLPAELGGIWTRLNQSTSSVQKGMFYEANGYLTLCDYCKIPRRNIDITNISQ